MMRKNSLENLKVTLRSRFIFIIYLILFFQLTSCVNEDVEKVDFYGMYSPSDIEIKQDIQVYGYGPTLLIRRDGRVFFPVGVIQEFSDTTATGRIEFIDSRYILNVESIDSTLRGQWVFEDLDFIKSKGGELVPLTFKMVNDYYIISYTLLMRMDRLRE